MACIFGHKWDGCKCTKCGKTRETGHNFESGRCTICGAKGVSLFNEFTAKELATILVAAATIKSAFDKKETALHESLDAILAACHNENGGYVTAGNFAIMCTCISKYSQLIPSLIKPDALREQRDICLSIMNKGIEIAKQL